MAIFMMLTLPNHEHGMFFHLFVSSLISMSSGLQFSLKRYFTFFVSCIFRFFYSLCSNCEWVFTFDLALSLLLVHKNACDFCTLILYPEALLKLLISLRKFWIKMMGSSNYTIMSSANRDNLASSFPNLISFISFSCLIVLARTSNTMLNRSGERGHP